MTRRAEPRFDHGRALRLVRDHAGYTEEARNVLFAMLVFADHRGNVQADEETVTKAANLVGYAREQGQDPVAYIERCRADVRRLARDLQELTA